MPLFGIVAIGGPGAGKSTFTAGACQLLTALGRPVSTVNLDPANESIPYECAVDIQQLVRVPDVMEQLHLGPNGAMVYCMDFLLHNIDWLLDRIRALKESYLLFDLPGQVELYTHHQATKGILTALQKNLDCRLCAVHLVDSMHVSDTSRYIAVLLLSLSTMLHLELPHLNVLSKVDLVEQYGPLPQPLEFFTEAQDLDHLLAAEEDYESSSTNPVSRDPWLSRQRKLNELISDLVTEFGLLSFLTLDVQDKHSMVKVIRAADKANGCIYRELGAEVGPGVIQHLPEQHQRQARGDPSSLTTSLSSSSTIQEHVPQKKPS